MAAQKLEQWLGQGRGGGPARRLAALQLEGEQAPNPQFSEGEEEEHDLPQFAALKGGHGSSGGRGTAGRGRETNGAGERRTFVPGIDGKVHYRIDCRTCKAWGHYSEQCPNRNKSARQENWMARRRAGLCPPGTLTIQFPRNTGRKQQFATPALDHWVVECCRTLVEPGRSPGLSA